MIWEDNAALRTSLESKQLPQIKIFPVAIADGFNAIVRMILPAQIDFEANDGAEKFPMLVRVMTELSSMFAVINFTFNFRFTADRARLES